MTYETAKELIIRAYKNNHTKLNLSNNNLTQLPPEIRELKNLKNLDLSYNWLNRFPLEIIELENLETLYLSNNYFTQIPPEIRELKKLKTLHVSSDKLTHLPPELAELKNLRTLYLSNNNLTQLPLEIWELQNLTKLYLSCSQLIQLPSEIKKLKNLTELHFFKSKITELPTEITELKHLKTLYFFENTLTFPPPEIVSRGVEAIFTYLKQSKTTENNEAKLILVGNGEVGKTCLANRLIDGKFVKDKITEGINISKWKIPSPNSENSEIKLNIWDFGGQEIYHATHQFFLTKRSVYLLVWNARKTKDYDHIYYWLHTIEAFGEDSPIILVMSKMNECDDDLNLRDLKNQFPQIIDNIKIDSYDGKGIHSLKECIRKTAWNLPLMRTPWVDSWFKVRQKLESLGKNWIPYDKFNEICKFEGLDDENMNVLDDYLNDLGVTLHFKDRLTLKNIVILKPEWATGAFYKILSTKFVLGNEGILPQSKLSQIWDAETYPPSVYPQLMDLMNKFELSYELPDKKRYLVAELLPKSSPNFMWDEKDNLCFYYCYNHFLPSGIITRFIVRMHQDIEKKENGMPLCWREGAVLKLQNSRALVKVKPDERQIEIRIKGGNKRGALGAICSQLNHINASIKKINVSQQIPCICSNNCLQRYLYDDLLKAEMNNIETIQCYKSFKHISISLLLDGYKRKEERFKEYRDISRQLGQPFVFSPNVITSLEAKQIVEAKQETNVNINVNINLSIELPQIQTEFDNLKDILENLNPKLDLDLKEIQDSLDEVGANSEKEKLNKPFNKLRRFLNKLGDPNSNYNKAITGTQKGIEYAQKLGRTYNKFAQLLAMPQVPDLFLGK